MSAARVPEILQRANFQRARATDAMPAELRTAADGPSAEAAAERLQPYGRSAWVRFAQQSSNVLIYDGCMDQHPTIDNPAKEERR